MIKGALGIAKLSDVALNASFTEAVQRDCSGDSHCRLDEGKYEKHSNG
jgi:hypothetical protein